MSQEEITPLEQERHFANSESKDAQQDGLIATTALILNDLVEKRRKEKRNGRIIAGLAISAMIGSLITAGMVIKPYLFPSVDVSSDSQHIAVVELKGDINSTGPSSSESMNYMLDLAFKGSSKIVVIEADSPGGLPVESDLIYKRINHLKSKYMKGVYVVIKNTCASGCYYIASAADQIYANPSSIVGSIGVKMEGFGFQNIIEKVGVERREYSAGKNKNFMSPFQAATKESEAHITGMLEAIHTEFKNAVKKGRGSRLKDDPDLFTGLVWTGRQSQEIGLVDKIGNIHDIAREQNMSDEQIVYYRPAKPINLSLFKLLGIHAAKGFKEEISSYTLDIR